MRDAVRRLRQFVVHNILHLDDTPQRIALGVALGFFVAWTPTIGLQMIIYLLVASVIPANKLSGIGPIWITNPLTAVPIYYGNWWVGHALLQKPGDDASEAEVAAALHAIERVGSDWSRFGEASFWRELGMAAKALGVELWAGSILVGLLLGGISYFVTYRLTVAHRAHKRERAEKHSHPELL